MNNRLLWLWLSLKPNMNSHKITSLLSVFENINDIYAASKSDYAGIGALTADDISALSDKSTESVQSTVKTLETLGAGFLTYDDLDFPDMLRSIENPPYVLYIKGEILKWDRLLPIAVVGTRHYNDYGIRCTKSICTDLARAGITIVSGMARGIDTAAAVSAVRAKSKTIAVLGCGIDTVYPPENGKLMDAIIKCGAVITEYPPGTQPYGRNFPERNRIISGLAKGTLVVQAPAKSGALITANYALNSGRDVFAVPGDIYSPLSKGCNELIKAGAKLTDSAQDILNEYTYDTRLLSLPHTGNNVSTVSEPLPKPAVNNVKRISIDDKRYEMLSGDEKKIISILIEKNMHIDDIVRSSGMSMGSVNSVLTMLEMKTFIMQMPGKCFRINI